MRIWLIGILALLMSVAAMAADISGKWKAEFATADGTQRVNTFTFKVDGAKLTGTVAGTQDETQIQNGKINGDDVSFTAERPFVRPALFRDRNFAAGVLFVSVIGLTYYSSMALQPLYLQTLMG